MSFHEQASPQVEVDADLHLMLGRVGVDPKGLGQIGDGLFAPGPPAETHPPPGVSRSPIGPVGHQFYDLVEIGDCLIIFSLRVVHIASLHIGRVKTRILRDGPGEQFKGFGRASVCGMPPCLGEKLT